MNAETAELKSLCKQLSALLEPEGGAVKVPPADRRATLRACVDAQWVLAIQIAHLVER